MEKQRQKEAEEWRVKGEKYMQEQEAAPFYCFGTV